MTGQPPDHGPFDELAAGYVLDALEPADEQRYLHHAEQCPDCAETLAGFREVAAALADTAPRAEPSPQLGDRILAAALADLGRRPADPAAAPGSTGAGATPATDTPRRAAPWMGEGWRDTAARADAPGTPADAGATPAGADAGPPSGTGPPADALPPGVVPGRPQGRRWLRPVTAAAAAALIAAGGVLAGLASSGSNGAPPSSCAHVRGCTEITLLGAATHRPAARLIVTGGTAWMVSLTMKADDTADQVYVLWQITGSHRPLAVGSFDVRPGASGPVKVGPLATSLRGTFAFAVSLEHGRMIPPKPSGIAALGQVT